MQTSNYWNYTNLENSVSIAGRCPDFYTGPQFKKLAPLYFFFKKYKEDKDEEQYIKYYNELILDKLDPLETYKLLGENSVLLCWEKPGEFCHRRIVAKWFEDKLGVKVNEYVS